LKKIAKTMDTASSPYAKLVQVREANMKSMVESRSITPDDVAEVLLKAITSTNPDLSSVVGNDAAGLLESKSSMTDSEFRKFKMKNFFGSESKSNISK
jgi:hypothetical protein